MTTLTRWLTAIAIALALSINWEQPTDIDAMQDVAADVRDAIHTAQASAREPRQ